MKKLIVLCCSVVILLSFSTAFAIDSSTKNYLRENGVDSHRYEDYFDGEYTPEEYVALCKHFEQYDAELLYAIGENAYVVRQDFSTYSKVDVRYRIMSYDGSILRDYGDSIIGDYVRIGNYVFVMTESYPATYDIFNTDGQFISIFDENSSVNYYSASVRLRADLGDGYYLFENVRSGDGKGSGDFYILNPQGEVCQLHTYYYDFHVMKTYYADIDKNEMLGRTNGHVTGLVEVGKISEGRFAIWGNNVYRGYFAVYFDVNGTRLIDLSEKATGFEVTKLGEFCNGQAEIEFRGVDYREYVGVIDAAGEFVGEPERKK